MMFPMLLLTGCMETQFYISGPVTDGPQEDSAPVPDASVVLRDSTGTVYSEAVTNSEGWFEALMPPQQIFYMVTDAEGYTPTSYSGLSAAAPFEIIEGEVWIRRTEDLDAVREEFTGCTPEDPDAGTGVIEGEVRLYVIDGQEPDELPLITTAVVTAYTVDGSVTTGCYLDDEGVSNPDASVTGQTGRFALFNVPSGQISINIRYDYGGNEPHDDWYVVYVPEDGVVPLYPAYSTMPY